MKFEKYKSLVKRQEIINEMFKEIDEREYKKLMGCGYYVYSATCKKCGTRHFKGFNQCKSRFCIKCSRIRTLKYLVLFIKKVDMEIYNIHHLVLTLKNYDDVSVMLKDIKKYWREFYNSDKKFREEFKKRFLGILRSIEVKKGRDEKWHIHMHTILITNKEYRKDYDFIKERWKKVTEGRGSVFIKKAKDYKAVIEVVKYVTNFFKCDLKDLKEIYQCVKGERLIEVSGILRGIDKEAEEMEIMEKEAIEFICKKCGYNEYEIEAIVYHDCLEMSDL
ncbi:MAG: protein rep [Caldisericum exile]|uniref:protein rep n=1 Tax=Caldisericum exile TaxID=693075 RepID=UPI003C735F6B